MLNVTQHSHSARVFYQVLSLITHYDQSKELMLATDASQYGTGAVISHRMSDGSEKSTASASRTLSTADKNYSQFEKEALTILFRVKKFHLYLFGRFFTLVTDYRPLVRIFGPKTGVPKMAAARIQRCVLIMAGYKCEIQFKLSKENTNADA